MAGDNGRRALRWAGALCLLAAPARAQVAQAVPNAGGISIANQRNQQVIEQQAQPSFTGPLVVGPKPPETLVPPPGGVTFLLSKVVFDHSEFISDAELNALAAPYIGTRMDNAQMQRLLKSVNDIYAERKIITALAYLPKQDLKSGVLKIGMVEGRLGQMTVKGNEVIKAVEIADTVRQKAGAVIDVSELEDDVAWFNKAHNAQIQAGLQPGAGFGLTDVQLSVLEPHQDILQLFTDNQGIESVGKYEGGVNYQHYGLLGMDDKFSGYVAISHGDDNVNLSYNIAFLPWGGRLGASFSDGVDRVYEGAYALLGIAGRSQSGSVNLSQPIFVNSNWAFLANGALTRGDYVSRQAGVLVTNDLTDKATMGGTLSYTSEPFQASIAPTYSFARSTYLVVDTNENFQAFNSVYSASLKLPYGFTLTEGGAAQWANQKLLAGDQLFQIGGPTTVRGYPTNAVAGYAGYFNNLELHHGLGELFNGLSGFVFYDNGMVFSTFPQTVTMNSLGAGLSWDSRYYLTSDLSFGVPLTKAVNDTASWYIYYRVTAKFE
jgi:hemolysin activation/secretion protein